MSTTRRKSSCIQAAVRRRCAKLVPGLFYEPFRIIFCELSENYTFTPPFESIFRRKTCFYQYCLAAILSKMKSVVKSPTYNHLVILLLCLKASVRTLFWATLLFVLHTLINLVSYFLCH